MGPSSRKPKLFVYAGAPGKHLLRHVSVRRVRQYPPDDPGPFSPHMAVFPSSQNIDFVRRAAEIPDSVWSRARHGLGKVVFDASLEGRPHADETSAALHGFLAKAGLGPEAGVYVTQNRQYGADYQAYCARMGLKRTMKVVYYDYWLRRFVREYEEGGEAVFRRRLADFRARAPTRDRRFISLNLTARPTKVLFLLSLIRDGLWDQGFVSFGGFDLALRLGDKSMAKFERSIGALPGFEDLSAELSPLVPTLDAFGVISFGHVDLSDGAAHVPAHDEALPEYARSWFSVITETEMADRPARITEKPMKPLFNFHPLVMLGNPGALKMIRELGFQTFPELIDEAYDDEPDPRRRFDLAYAEVRRLCRLDEAELARLDAAISEKLFSNAEGGLPRLPRIFREEIDEALVNDIMGPEPPPM